MVFNFSFPYFLILIPVVLIFLSVITVMDKNRNSFQKYFALVVRCIVSLMIILSLAGFSVREYVESATTVFAVDLSASVAKNKEEALRLILESQKEKKEQDSIGIVCFGENSVIEFMPSDDKNITDIYSYIKDGYTNISSALNVVGSIIPEKSHKRIILISDGLENIDSALSAAKSLKKRGVEVSTYYIRNEIEKEVQLTELKLPKNVNKGFKYDIEVGVYSLQGTESRILIYKNNKIIADENVVVRQGGNKYVFTDTAGTGGSQIYRAEIQPPEDTYAENNTLYSYSYVEDMPNVLVIGKDSSAEQIVNIMGMSSVNMTHIQAAEAPVSIEKLNQYQAVIMADVSIDDLPKLFEEALEVYVKNTGGGLIVTGGENSYALGGYYNTAIEKALPVDMQLKNENNKPNLGMIIVIDRSGSMTAGNYGVSKLGLAKEAVIRSIDVLDDSDNIGVLAFDDGNSWAVEMRQISGGKDAIEERISKISPGGGTSILPALKEAYEVLKNSDTKLKHIILLTDGQAEQTGYDGLISDMIGDSITLSCVAVGSDADKRLLQELSDRGSGRYYFTDEFTDLPKIFVKETYLAGKSFLNNYTFTPVETSASSILSEINTLPPLEGYISTTPKDRADVILSSDKDEPILASWQYGLGRSVAWTSDMNNMWTSQWLSDDNGAAVFRNAVSWVLRKEVNLNANIDVIQNGKESEIMLTLPFSEGIKDIKGSAFDRNNNEFAFDFESVAPGVYKTKINSGESGAYITNFEVEKDSGIINMTMGINIPYSKEYDIRNYKSGEVLMNKIANETGGKIIKSSSDVFLPFQNNIFGDYDLSNILLACALVLLLLDIAVRQFSFITSHIESILGKAISNIRLKKRQRFKESNKHIKKNIENAESKLQRKIENSKEENSKRENSKRENIEKQDIKSEMDNGKIGLESKTYTSSELLSRMKKRKGDGD